jgi:hypothetical protein
MVRYDRFAGTEPPNLVGADGPHLLCTEAPEQFHQLAIAYRLHGMILVQLDSVV